MVLTREMTHYVREMGIVKYKYAPELVDRYITLIRYPEVFYNRSELSFWDVGAHDFVNDFGITGSLIEHLVSIGDGKYKVMFQNLKQLALDFDKHLDDQLENLRKETLATSKLSFAQWLYDHLETLPVAAFQVPLYAFQDISIEDSRFSPSK